MCCFDGILVLRPIYASVLFRFRLSGLIASSSLSSAPVSCCVRSLAGRIRSPEIRQRRKIAYRYTAAVWSWSTTVSCSAEQLPQPVSQYTRSSTQVPGRLLFAPTGICIARRTFRRGCTLMKRLRPVDLIIIIIRSPAPLI